MGGGPEACFTAIRYQLCAHTYVPMRLMRCTLCIGFHTRSSTSSAFLPFLSSRSTRTSQNITWAASGAMYIRNSATQRHDFLLDSPVYRITR